MNNKYDIYKAENIHPGFSIDCVIFSYYKHKIRVLLRKFQIKGYHALLGGFMMNDEDADQAAYRILKMETGASHIYMRQFYLFSDPNRTIMEQNKEYVRQNMKHKEEGEWMMRRFVSLGFCALVKYDDVNLNEVGDKSLKWFNITELPRLYSDHEHIIRKAIEIMKEILPVVPIGEALLPEKFTMSDLRIIYEIILGRKLDRRNFQRKMMTEGLLIQLDETKNNSSYNPPNLYSFNPNNNNKTIRL